MTAVTLENRSFIAVTGEDAEDLLQGIVTTDLSLIEAGQAWPGALLTPQGKILFEFLIGRRDGGFLLETAANEADLLIKRLTLYRLRAKAVFEKLNEDAVTISWGGDATDSGLADQRFARAGIMLTRSTGSNGRDDVSLYRQVRFAAGISGGGEDGPLNDYFPHDLMMDKNGGLSFKKGCYIGQEVVSRMQHRSTARRRMVLVHGERQIGEPGAAIVAGDRDIGVLVASDGRAGLGVVRIDKAGAAMQADLAITTGEQPVTLTLPAWSGLEFPIEADETAS